MGNKRNSEREQCYSKMWFIDHNLPAYLIDISSTGLKIEIFQKICWKEGSVKRIKIIPFEEIGIAPYETSIEIRWIKEEDGSTAAGAVIIPSDRETEKRFLQIYKYYEVS